MPNRKKRARRRQGGASALLPALIAALAVVAVALAVLLVRSNPFETETEDGRLPYRYDNPIYFAGEATAEPLTLGATPAPLTTRQPAVRTPMPTPTPSPIPLWGKIEDEAEATKEPEEEISSPFAPTPMPGDYFLPIYDRALRTPDDRAMIAVTIDNCDKPETMKQIMATADLYGAKLTLFPTGAALMDHPEEFISCHRDGHELENHTYDAGKLDYTLGSGELALQIWRQGIATSYVLRHDYRQHFYRPTNRHSSVDQRTHFFLRKLGLYGVASYTYSYLYHDVDYLSGTLANGNIYQFDMSKESMAVFEGFLSEANRKGYKMVTMNELFGLEDNALSDELTIDKQELPGMEDYWATLYPLKLYDRAHAVYDIQERLLDLGYLIQVPGDHMADGIYGSDTSIAMSEFQAAVGLAATGNADVDSQVLLLSDEAPPKAQ